MSADPSANQFDRIAVCYDFLARLVFGKTLQQAQASWLDRLPPGGEIVILGGGSGRILKAMATLAPPQRAIHFVDSSARMIRRAQRHAASLRRSAPDCSVQLHAMRVEDWCRDRTHGTRLDAVVTPFFLDCFDGADLQGVMDGIDQVLRPGGLWLMTDFSASPKVVHRLTVGLMFAFFSTTCRLASRKLENYSGLIEDRGYSPLGRMQLGSLAGPVISELWRKGEKQRD